ncbi:hypothetical protein [Pelagibacterium sp.]|uniref:hypothetical protein n=1 Tax=Pelagibacterium sp. TaxID=1967288 RepID=UPI003A95541A
MFKKTTTLVAALTLFAVPTAAFAQATVGGVAVPTDGLPYVVSYCEDLDSMSASDRFDHAPRHAQSVASGISLKTITLNDCQRAGLI